MTIEETVDVYIGRTNSEGAPLKRYTGLFYSGVRGDEHDRVRGSNPAEFIESLKERENLKSKKINLLKWDPKINSRLFAFFNISDEEFSDFKKAVEIYNNSLKWVKSKDL